MKNQNMLLCAGSPNLDTKNCTVVLYIHEQEAIPSLKRYFSETIEMGVWALGEHEKSYRKTDKISLFLTKHIDTGSGGIFYYERLNR